MRFDDMIATVLAQPAMRPGHRAVQWRQLVDLLAQRRHGAASSECARAFEFLRIHREQMRIEERQAVARSLSGLPIAPELLAFFAEDHPTVAGPLIAGARIEGADWIKLLPSLGPTARALLRHRRDLPLEVTQALAAFGPSDLVLEGASSSDNPAADRPASDSGSPNGSANEGQIRELVARIEAFRKRNKREPTGQASSSPSGEAEEFRWETGPDGIILWIDAAWRGALIGQSIASTAGRGQHGVDGQAAGAFEKRAPFRDARLIVPGSGPASGDWRISGVPFFEPRRGNFLGYRGAARRPRIDEVASAAEGHGLFGSRFPADSLRQLVHELRTPLNAVIGFAEMIEGQYMGPAGFAYRERAGTMIDQARRLLSAVDDLDTAARLETRRLDFEASPADAVALLSRLGEAYEEVARQRGFRLAVEIAPGLPAAHVDAGAVERMFSRLLAATIGLAADGEAVSADLEARSFEGKPMLCLAIDRPQAIDGIDEPALLDPGYSPEGDWPGAPALGLGFALRLVRSIAEAVGGALTVGERRVFLYLPAAQPDDRDGDRIGQGGA